MKLNNNIENTRKGEKIFVSDDSEGADEENWFAILRLSCDRIASERVGNDRRTWMVLSTDDIILRFLN